MIMGGKNKPRSNTDEPVVWCYAQKIFEGYEHDYNDYGSTK